MAKSISYAGKLCFIGNHCSSNAGNPRYTLKVFLKETGEVITGVTACNASWAYALPSERDYGRDYSSGIDCMVSYHYTKKTGRCIIDDVKLLVKVGLE